MSVPSNTRKDRLDRQTSEAGNIEDSRDSEHEDEHRQRVRERSKLQEILKELANDGKIFTIIDLEHVTYFDSLAIGLLVAHYIFREPARRPRSSLEGR